MVEYIKILIVLRYMIIIGFISSFIIFFIFVFEIVRFLMKGEFIAVVIYFFLFIVFGFLVLIFGFEFVRVVLER